MRTKNWSWQFQCSSAYAAKTAVKSFYPSKENTVISEQLFKPLICKFFYMCTFETSEAVYCSASQN